MLFVYENYNQLNENPEEYIQKNKLENIGSCYYFKLNFKTDFVTTLENIQNKYLPNALKLFQKYICQNMKVINDAPDLYIYYNIEYVRKDHNKITLKTKTWKLPKINGFVFTTTYLPENKFYGMKCGLLRETFCDLKLNLINQTQDIFIQNLKEGEGLPEHCIFDLYKRFANDENDKIDNIIKNFKFENSFLLKCHTYKYLSSKGELKCSQILSKHKYIKSIKKQYIFDDCINTNPLPFDFYIELENGKWFLLEYNGQQHYKEVKFWDGENGFKERQHRDSIK